MRKCALLRTASLLTILLCLLPKLLLANPVFGVFTAMPNEAQLIIDNLQHKHVVKKGLYHYTLGDINGKSVVVLTGGIGVINAAVATTNLIIDFNPKYLLLSGCAGGVQNGMHVGDVVAAKNAYMFDLGDPEKITPKLMPDTPRNPVRHELERVIYPSAPILLNAVKKLQLKKPLLAYRADGKHVPAKIMIGSIATSDHFPNSMDDSLRMHILGIKATAMETASFLKVCWLYRKPCIAFRSMSDSLIPLEPLTPYNTWNKQNETLAVNNSGAVAVALMKSNLH